MKILRFTAAWCSPCQRLGPIVDALVVNADIDLQVIDVDQHSDVAHRYGIKAVPTVVVISDDDVPVESWSGTRAVTGLRDYLTETS